MTPIEVLLRIAEGEGEVFDQARTMIGISNIALLIANEAVKSTSAKLRPCDVAKAIGLGPDAAKDRIENTVIKN
jgi:hypothetical protein